MLSEYIHRRGLIADGPPRDGPPQHTPGAQLLPVLWRGQRAMLKVAKVPEELPGFDLMVWWHGVGAARLFARQGPALLLERAQNSDALAQLSRTGQDDAAGRILCAVVEKLHARRAPAPLSLRFQGLEAAARQHAGVLRSAHTTACRLLAAPQDVRCLHGAIHHGNVLDFGALGGRGLQRCRCGHQPHGHGAHRAGA